MNSKGQASVEKNRFFSNPLINETLKFLPKALEFENEMDFKKFLIRQLPQNSEYVRRRYARYIANRFFDNGKPKKPFIVFIQTFGEDAKPSKEALFFELLMKEPVLRQACKGFFSKRVGHEAKKAELESFLIGSYGGDLDRDATRKSARHQARDIVRVLKELDRIEVIKPGEYLVKARKPSFLEFLYVLHRLFPQPGMYRAEEFLHDDAVDALIWDKNDLKEFLYKAWREKYLAKVSEIDQYFHFSTRYSLTDFVERMKNEDTTDM
jgi:hypothetical protein